MNPMSKEIIKEIHRAETSYLNEEIDKLSENGIKVEFDNEIIDEIADYVMRKTDKDDNLNTGARAIESIINYIFEDIWYKALQKEDDEIYIFKLLKGITEDNLKYETLN